MGCFGRTLLGIFRFIQFVCSLIALGCGIYIAYSMLTMSEAAKDLVKAINELHGNQTWIDSAQDTATSSGSQDVDDMTDALTNLLDLFVPVLQNFAETPTRAILVMVAAAWSIFVIAYIFFANRSRNHQGTNKRWIRVLLELATIIFWIVSIVCAVLLTLQYGVLAFAGGLPIKTAMTTMRALLANVLVTIVSANDNVENVLDIVSNLVTVGLMAIVCTVASCVCCLVCLISLIVACCTKGKQNQSENIRYGAMPVMAQNSGQGYMAKTGTTIHVTENSYHMPSPMTPGTPGSHQKFNYQPYQDRQMV